MKITPPRLAAGFVAATAAVASFGISAGATTPPSNEALALVEKSSALVADAPMRFDMTMEISGAPIDFGDTPLITGSIAGDDVDMSVDMSAIFASAGMPAEFEGTDLSMHMRVIDNSQIYVKGGMFALMSQFDASFTQFSQLSGDTWGSVDATQVSDFDDLVGEMAGAGSPTSALATLETVSSAEVTGTETVDGEEMTVVRITVPASELGELTGNTGISSDLADSGVEIPYDVYIDEAGFPRQLVINLDQETVAAAAEASGDADALDDFAIEMKMTLRFFDYNDSSITVTAPTDVIDVTADFLKMSQGS